MKTDELTLSIIVPAYNEEKTIEKVLEDLIKIEWYKTVVLKEIIVINDGSKDKTEELVLKMKSKSNKINLINNQKNIGKSQSVKRGILESSGDLVIVQDADFEYDPNEINLLLKELVEKDLDVVYGNRFGRKNKVIYWHNYYGNKLLSIFSNLFTYFRIKKYIPDMEVCYKLIKGQIARDIALKIESKSNFGIEPEITAKLSKYKIGQNHLKFGVVPISYYPRTIAEGKKIKAIKDGIKALKEIIIFNLIR